MLTAWETNRNAICSKFMNRWRARLFQSIKRKHSTTSTGISWTEFLKRWNLVLNFEPWSGVYTRTFKVPFCRTVCVGVLQRRTGCASRIPLIASSVCSSCRSVGQAIRKSSEIQGFRVPGGREVKISQYADDNTCIVTTRMAPLKWLTWSTNMEQLLVLVSTSRSPKACGWVVGNREQTPPVALCG